MNLVVIADASSANYLLETGYIDVLPNLYGQIILPPCDSSQRTLGPG